MAGGMKKKVQSIFRCTGTVRDTASNKDSKRMIFQSSNEYLFENGRVLLEERVSLFHGKTNHIRCLSVNDLNTHFKDWIRYYEPFSGFQYQCVWEGRLVLVKFYKHTHSTYTILEECCREIAVATQMGTHKNVHKLLACCLETEIPVLVYEYVENGCLLDRILKEKNQNKPPLEWKDRLRIAWEISHAVAYLHTAFPRPIIHRDLKPSNVLLDGNNVAKLTDFSFCVSIPKGKTSLQLDCIVGTYGYLAPEYLRRGKLVEKSDVYSFGVLFVELMTGQSHHDWYSVMEPYNNVEESSGSSMEYFDHLLELSLHIVEREFVKDNTNNIITRNLTETANEDLPVKQLQASIELALRCIAEEEDSRPTMEEVATQLKNIITSSGSSIPTTSTSTPQ